VDLEYFGVNGHQAASGNCAASTPAGPECVFVGALDYLPNIDGITWFARAIWPAVHARFPDAKLVLVGRRPVAVVRELGRLPGIEVIGEVLDVRPYLHRASIVVVPLRIARGVQNKVLEALAAGKAVIASPQALEGLDVAANKQVLRAETGEQWVACISALLSDNVARCRLAVAGQAYAVRYHEWAKCLRAFNELLELNENNGTLPSCTHEPVTSPSERALMSVNSPV
jgi:glycosyltransferase involved in cell wall biosynthesis